MKKQCIVYEEPVYIRKIGDLVFEHRPESDWEYNKFRIKEKTFGTTGISQHSFQDAFNDLVYSMMPAQVRRVKEVQRKLIKSRNEH